ncbi:MAG: histidinol-phosphate transaminase [Clostridia bacterium]|nr:histidinol-phosphate transaminase [Clostridia bacterium]
MSRFFTEKLNNLEPYTPGEQPRDMQYIKLNTNESPFPPSEKAIRYAAEEAERLRLYPDPECKGLTEKLAAYYDVAPENVVVNNGSDETLYFAFMAFCDEKRPAYFPNISYGFYPVFAQVNRLPYTELPLRDDFTVDPEDYIGKNAFVVIANPNAPTGIALTLAQIERIVAGNPDGVVVVDEAYVDFGAESAVALTKQYDNLLVVQTYSKSRSLAGARLGFGIGDAALIRDLNTIKFSTNPYNINRMTMAAGVGALEDDDHMKANCRAIMENRAWTVAELQKIGFTVLDSAANFIFARHPRIDGKELYLTLKANGILVRHFNKEALCQYNRITIGTREQMETLIAAIRRLWEDQL